MTFVTFHPATKISVSFYSKILIGGCFLFVIALTGCVKERCFQNADCAAPSYCNTSAGKCVYECASDSDCGAGFRCQSSRCILKSADGDGEENAASLVCPEDMANIGDAYCIDRYEASRPDATESSPGTDNSRAVSVKGVIPWQATSNAVAEAACNASGKRLCTPSEWTLACKGPNASSYAYGNVYDPLACNGIDANGPNRFRLMPTGSFQGCANEWGVFDMNGNLWERISNGNDQTVRGGAYNCIDSATLHRCDYIPGSWSPSAIGFRCCLSEVIPETDGDGEPIDKEIAEPDVDNSENEEEGGCLPDENAEEELETDGDEDNSALEDYEDEIILDEDGDDEALDDEEDEVTLDENGDDADIVNEEDVELDSEEEDYEKDLSDADMEPEGEIEKEYSGCPPDMAPVGSICVDIWEASKPDATANSMGIDDSRATSRPGVLPWHVSQMTLSARDAFAAACEASGKRLCTNDEWFEACNGPDDATYFFGNVWNPEICNCVDTFCDDYCADNGISQCMTNENCGYQYYCFYITPTGSFPDCTNAYGLFDVNGNVWEITLSNEPRGYEVRGGAFNCGSPSVRLQCAFNASWNDLYAGFRCCKDRDVP